MSDKLEAKRIEAILEAFDNSIDLGDFQYEARDAFAHELKTTGELDFLQAPTPPDGIEGLKARYAYLKLGGAWDRVPLSDNGEQYLAGFEDAMKTLGVKP